MVRIYEGKTSASIYRNQLEDLVLCPEHIVTVRGRPTREILNVVTEIEDPRARCQIVPGRKLNPWLAMSECLWMLAGRNDVASLLPYNKGITEFSDDGKTMYGAYGIRIINDIPFVIERLRESDTDRRAVLQIWQPDDLFAETKDPPCNTQVMFKLREGKLNMLVTNRSNDLHWGLHAVNLFQFGVLQEYVACRLGVEMGVQTHFSNSLHIYTDEKASSISTRMMLAMAESIEELPVDDWFFPNPFPEEVKHHEFAKACGAVLDGEYGKSYLRFPFLEFAEDFLRVYREQDGLIPIRNSNMYRFWIRMADEFAPYLGVGSE